jgi:hypothetical protein
MERLILRGARLFDGTGRAPHGNLAVVAASISAAASSCPG